MRRNEQKKDPSLAGTSEGRETTKGLDRPDFVSFQATAHGAGAQPQLTGPAPGQSPAPDEGDRPGTGREQTKLEQDFLRARRQTPDPRFPPTRAGRCRPR